MKQIQNFDTIKEASEKLSISLSCIKDVLREKQKRENFGKYSTKMADTQDYIKNKTA